jgi:toxin-antitoxin system PIN domain toxin
LVDANLLLYARDADSPHFQAAHHWLRGQLSSLSRVGLPWPVLLAYVRIASNRRIFPNAIPAARLWEDVCEWLAMPQVWVPEATDRHTEVMTELLADVGHRSDLVPDAHLAALAIGHGLTLCSTDRDFARFRGLRWENPLQ